VGMYATSINAIHERNLSICFFIINSLCYVGRRTSKIKSSTKKTWDV